MKGNKNLIIISTIVVIVVVGLWVFAYYSLIDDTTNRGTFGDMFGGLNALFSGLAFGGIIITILLQSKELSLQREELKETREEFKTQNETLRLQRFENTFFKIIELNNSILNGVVKKERKLSSSVHNPVSFNEITGREMLNFEGDKLYKNIKTEIRINETFSTHFGEIKRYLNNYFNNLVLLINIVDEIEFIDKGTDKLNSGNKKKYFNILKSQLSDYEVMWLFYYSLSIHGIGNLKPVLERNSFFENDSLALVHDPHIHYFSDMAFKSN